MKKLLLLLFSLLISFNSWGEVELDFSSDTFCDQSPKVQVRDGLFYLPNQQKPYSGENLCVYLSNGQYYSQGEIKKGLRDGKWTYWYENGEKKPDILYVGGEVVKDLIDITIEKLYDNGQVEWSRTWKDSKEDGKWSEWYENGQLLFEGNYIGGKKVGKWVEWYENGQIWIEKNYKEGNYDGKLTVWDSDGQKSLESYYIDGIKDGVSTSYNDGLIWLVDVYKNGEKVKHTYYKNGQKSLEENYKNDELNGKSTHWYENGNKSFECNYENGKLNGNKTWWNEDGQIESEENYRNGLKLRETWFHYYPSGQLEKEMNYREDGYTKDGKQTYWYEDGQIEREYNYKNGRQQDTTAWNEIGQKTTVHYYLNNSLNKAIRWKYYENGQAKEEAHLDMTSVNPVYIYLIRWHENGQKSQEVNYKDGKKDGKWTWWHENGQKREERNYKDDKKHGKGTAWYENGQIKYEGNYKDDKSVGKVTMWHENGQKKLEANYKDGKKDGIWTIWDENGQKMSKTIFKDGE